MPARPAARSRAGRATALVLALAALALPAPASAHRRGLASTVGGATLGQGQALWVGLGYPALGGGWGVAVHPWVDLLLHGEVVLGHPARVDRLVTGGGGGLVGRLGLLRGRTSLALTARVGATAYGEGGGVAALVDLGSPGLDLSFRVAPRVGLHAGLRVVLGYVTEPSDLLGGFEGRLGLTVGLTERLALFGVLAWGATLWDARGPVTARLDATVGLEYRLGARPGAPGPEPLEIRGSTP